MDDTSATGLSGPQHEALEGRATEVWIRRALLGLLTAFLIAGLLSVFGQVERVRTVAGASGARVTLTAPDRLRGGLIFQTKVVVEASETIDDPQLVLSAGFLDGVTLNTVEPGPVNERSESDRLILRYPRIREGTTMTAWFEHQVNPTTTGSRVQKFTLRDGDQSLATIARTVQILP